MLARVRELPRVPIIWMPGQLGLRETLVVSAARPVLLAFVQPANDAVARAARSGRKERHVLLHLEQLLHLFLRLLVSISDPEIQVHPTSYPIVQLSLAPEPIRLVHGNRH